MEAVNLGHFAVGPAFRPEVVVIEFKLEAIVDDVFIRRHGDEGFPAVGHEGGWPHGIKLILNRHLRADAVPTERLLLGGQGGIHRVKAIGVSEFLLWSQVGDGGGGAAGHQQGQRQDW